MSDTYPLVILIIMQAFDENFKINVFYSCYKLKQGYRVGMGRT